MHKINPDEWLEISNKLEQHHAIFYKLWAVGKPIFKDEIETAAIEFDRNGNYIQFSFNPIFWSNLSLDSKLFVICHEMLHVILNHGKRSKNLNIQKKVTANICLDIVVNHSLINNFGFEKNNIEVGIRNAINSNSENNEKSILCWVDNIFPDEKYPEDECFEFYFNKYNEKYGDGHSNQASNPNQGCLDDHSQLSEEDYDKFIGNIISNLSKDEIEAIANFAKKNQDISLAGSGIGWWHSFSSLSKQIKKKWETIIRSWEIKKSKDCYGSAEQWLRKSRRYVNIDDNLFLPCEIETYQRITEEDKINVFFFMDTSGSCFGLKDRFFKCASSLDSQKFKVRLFCFDTKVQETSLKSNRIYGGGGTSFSVIKNYIKKEIENNISKHPYVFVLTDGFGDTIKVDKPEKWHWFLTADGTKLWIDKNCNIYNLKDYE